ncbi:hypothetical protein F4810DRAFT_708791 [Camillea tinctor]|nr:hypothetical protein F4810DRAFT_708791 [Camillea tinctor]
MSQCSTCKKAPPAVNLKHCAKCSTTLYCSRDCQKADWKSHKKVCSKQQGAPGTTPSATPRGLDQTVARPFSRLDNGTWLHDRPEIDVYRLLIDAYRLRVADDGSGDSDASRGFQKFLELVASRKLLPPWWTSEKEEACKALSTDPSQWQNLSRTIQKSDVIEHYGDPQFPMQLRMFAEAAIGRGPRGADGTQTRKLMVAMEQGRMGGLGASVLDATTMNMAGLQT